MTRLEAALVYGDRGWPVLPIHTAIGSRCSCGRHDCDSPGKHPRTPKGHTDASVRASQIEGWWKTWPDANVAIVTGTPSGLVVLDVDCHGATDGLECLKTFLNGHALPQTPTVATGGDGRHYYFRIPDCGVRTRKLAGIGDLKSDGGYVLAPPSVHASGGTYSFLPGLGLGDLNLAPLPSLLEAEPPKEGPWRSDGEPIHEGSRNNRLAQIAGAMRGQGCVEEEIRVALIEVNRARCEPPLDEREVEAVAASIARYPESRSTSTGGTFWPRDIIRSLWQHPRELLLLTYLVTEAEWKDSRMSDRQMGTVARSLDAMGRDLQWIENNRYRELDGKQVQRSLEKLSNLGLVRVSHGGLVTTVEIVNYAQYKGIPATSASGLSQHVTGR